MLTEQTQKAFPHSEKTQYQQHGRDWPENTTDYCLKAFPAESIRRGQSWRGYMDTALVCRQAAHYSNLFSIDCHNRFEVPPAAHAAAGWSTTFLSSNQPWAVWGDETVENEQILHRNLCVTWSVPALCTKSVLGYDSSELFVRWTETGYRICFSRWFNPSAHTLLLRFYFWWEIIAFWLWSRKLHV